MVSSSTSTRRGPPSQPAPPPPQHDVSNGSVFATALHRHCTTGRTRPPTFGADSRPAASRRPRFGRKRMERLWKNEGATEGKRFGRLKPRNHPQQAKSLCHQLPPVAPNGKEGVDGSSPSEGFAKFLLI